MARVAWMHCFAGVSIETALGAFIDAGAGLDDVREITERLPLHDWAIGAEPVFRAGLGATHVVVAHDDDPSIIRTFAHVSGLIEEGRLPDRVRERSIDVLSALAQVTSTMHRTDPSRVQLADMGGVGAIVGIVATCAALEVLGIDEIVSSPVAQGTGVTRTRGQLLPIPSPSVMGLFADRDVPTYTHDVPLSITTPAGAAFIATLASSFGSMPRLRANAVGYGAADHDLDGLPSALQVIIGDRVPREHPGQRLVQLDTNVDDISGVILGHTIEAVMDAGAIDAWVTPTVGGRSRPAQILSAICDPVLVEQVATVIVRETGALDVRSHAVQRWSGARELAEVDVSGYPVQIRVGPGRVKADLDDAAMIARRTGMPLREVLSRAEAAWRRSAEVRQLHPAHRDTPLDTGI